MRSRTPRIVTALVVLAALAVGVAFGATTGGERELVQQVAGESTAARGETKATAAHLKRGPRGRRGRRGRRGQRGARGPVGPRGGDAITDLTINWRNGAWNGRDSAQATLTDVGVLNASCRPLDGDENGHHRLILTPSRSDVRTVVNYTTVQASDVANTRHESTGAPIDLALPVNGMATAVVSVEPVSGDGGPGPTPWSLQASSEMKLNGPGGAASGENFCYVALQAARGE